MDLGLRSAKALITAARRFSLEGALVVINSRSLNELQEMAAGFINGVALPVDGGRIRATM